MKLAANLPTYLPDIGFFKKMLLADVFVLADDYQYSKHQLINRTRIKTASGVKWLTVPVRTKGRGKQLILSVEIDKTQHWQRKHWKTLLVNYIYAPFFEHFMDAFESIYRKEWQRLFPLNYEIIQLLQELLEIKTPLWLSSQLKVTGRGTEKLLNILKELKCDTYLCLEGEEKFIDQQLFKENEINLMVIPFKEKAYHQQFGTFVPGLSIIDLLFNEGKQSKKIILKS